MAERKREIRQENIEERICVGGGHMEMVNGRRNIEDGHNTLERLRDRKSSNGRNRQKAESQTGREAGRRQSGLITKESKEEERDGELREKKERQS